MTTTTTDLISTLADDWAAAMRQWAGTSQALWDDSQTMWENWGTGRDRATSASPRHRHGRGCDCRCAHGGGERGGGERGAGGHGTDGHHPHDERPDGRRGKDCHCNCGDCSDCACCVPEADVVVHARAGERRVVPFRIRNTWRRERDVTVEAGPWHPCGGGDLVVRAILDESTITLAPCAEQVVQLILSVVGERDGSGQGGKDVKGARMHEEPSPGGAPFGTDLTRCESGYLDIRFEGCGRPQRVAVVVRPSRCDAVDAGCDCGCC